MSKLADVTIERHGAVPVASIAGEVDMSNAGELSDVLQHAVEQEAGGLVIDLTRTSYLDSAGLHFVFEIGKRLRDRGQRLALVVPESSSLNRLLDLVQVAAVAPIERSTEAALERLATTRE